MGDGLKDCKVFLKDAYDHCKNIMAGARYIKMMLDRYDGDAHLFVAAYNYGSGRTSRGMATGGGCALANTLAGLSP